MNRIKSVAPKVIRGRFINDDIPRVVVVAYYKAALQFWLIIEAKVKVNFALEQDMNTQKGSRGIVLLCL